MESQDKKSTYNKEYYEKNKEIYKQACKRYYEKNKQQIYEMNKPNIIKYNQSEKGKEKHKVHVKKYQQCEKAKEYKKEYYALKYPNMKQEYNCECGCILNCTPSNYNKHKLTNKHLELMKEKNI